MARTATVQDLIIVLQMFFPVGMKLQHALLVLSTIIVLFPLFKLHDYQWRGYHQPRYTAWLRSIIAMLVNAFDPPDDTDGGFWHNETEKIHLAEDLTRDVDILQEMLGLDTTHSIHDLIPDPPIIRCTQHLHCIFCGPEASLQ